jgi:adenylate cyclase
LFSLGSAGLLNYATEGRQKRYIKNAFQQYLSPAVIEQLIQHPERLRLGGERRELSVFFSDIQGFTTVSEKLTPEELTSLLNEYLSEMTDIIQEEGGTIDKYEGDAIIAFWNAPLDLEDHAERAVRASLRCQARLAELRSSFADRVGAEIRMRVGINTGPAVVGNLGSRSRFDYSMLGDSVNLAARLEGINKQFGTYTMISEMTRTAMGHVYPCRELSRVAVVGRNEPVRVFEPWLPAAYEEAKERLQHFEEALQLYYDGEFEKAEGLFREIADRDRPAAIYADRCRALAQEPPAEWSGVWTMTEK